MIKRPWMARPSLTHPNSHSPEERVSLPSLENSVYSPSQTPTKRSKTFPISGHGSVTGAAASLAAAHPLMPNHADDKNTALANHTASDWVLLRIPCLLRH